jgi:hypothetical protein
VDLVWVPILLGLGDENYDYSERRTKCMIERITRCVCLLRYPYMFRLYETNAKLQVLYNIHIKYTILILARPLGDEKAAHLAVVRIASPDQPCRTDIGSSYESNDGVSSSWFSYNHKYEPLQKACTSDPTTRTQNRSRSRSVQLEFELDKPRNDCMRIILPTIVRS